jgi:hypothetical protein
MSPDLRASTRLGTPFAAELDRKLAGDESLAKVVAWWRTTYDEWREPQLSAGNAAPLSFTENESAVLHLDVVWTIEELNRDLTEEIEDPIVQEAWGPVRQARATLRAAAAAVAAGGQAQA